MLRNFARQPCDGLGDGLLPDRMIEVDGGGVTQNRPATAQDAQIRRPGALTW